MPGVYYYQLDVTDFAAIESTAETIRRQHGDPTVLINNAGIGEHKIPFLFASGGIITKTPEIFFLMLTAPSTFSKRY